MSVIVKGDIQRKQSSCVSTFERTQERRLLLCYVEIACLPVDVVVLTVVVVVVPASTREEIPYMAVACLLLTAHCLLLFYCRQQLCGIILWEPLPLLSQGKVGQEQRAHQHSLVGGICCK